MSDGLDTFIFDGPLLQDVLPRRDAILLTKKDLEGASCPACYRKLPPATTHHSRRGEYCPRCVESGAAGRHRENRRRERR